MHCQTFVCHQCTCVNHGHGRIWYQTEVVNTGPRTDPWGTAKTRGVGGYARPSTIADCTLSAKCDSNQDNATSETPKVVSSRLNRMERSRVWKASLRSNRTSIDTSLWSDFLRRPSGTLKTAVLVLWFFLVAERWISSKQFVERLDYIWRTTSLSIF